MTGKTNYVLASLPAAGLGNRLFTWGRAKAYAELHDLRMLSPRWWQFRIGPYLRRERDLRCYVNQFQVVDGEKGGLSKWWLLARMRQLAEPLLLSDPPTENGIIRFSGWDSYFQPLSPYAAMIRRELHKAIHPSLQKQITEISAHLPVIGIHVRRGDFRIANDNSQFNREGALQTPIEWYVNLLNQIRMVAGRKIPAFVVSDGSDGELAPLVAAGEVTRIETRSAIADIVLLSKCKLILGTGGSSFSAWGAFLGNTPVLTCTQSLSWFGLTTETAGGLVSTIGWEKSDGTDFEVINHATALLS